MRRKAVKLCGAIAYKKSLKRLKIMVAKSPELKKRKAMDALFYLSFMIVPVIAFLVFYVYVNLDSFVMAFQRPIKGEQKLEFVWFDNFKWVFEKIREGDVDNPIDDLRLAFINTFKTFGIKMIMFPISLFVSYFIYKKILFYKAFRVMFYLPSIVSGVVVSFFFTTFVSPQSFFPGFLEKLYNLDYPLYNPLVDSTFANKMVFLHMVWLTFPANLIIWGGTFSRIPESVIESSRLDGVNWVQEMFVIILPLVWPTFVLMVTLELANVFGASGAVFLLTGGEYGTQTVSNWMYLKIYRTTNPYSVDYIYQVAAMGLLLTVISCAIAFLVRKFLVSKIEETTY